MKSASTSQDLGVSRWTVRFVLLGGAVAWTLHLLTAYVIAEFGVLSGLTEVRWVGLDAVSCLLLLWSAAMLTLAAVAACVSWRTPYSDEPADETARTVRFCVRFGRAANVTFIAIIAAQTVPIFFFLRSS